MNKVGLRIVFGILIVIVAGAAAFALNELVGWPIYTETPPLYELPPAETKPKQTTLFFAGDIMLSRNVGTKIVEANDPSLPYKNVQEVIKEADVAFANIESPFYDQGPRVTQGLIFKAEPNTAPALREAGFDILSTANNHSFDQGKEGVEYTIQWLRKNALDIVGTGLDCHDGTIVLTDNLKIGYLAYSYSAYNDGGRVPDPLVCDWNDQEKIAEDIQALKLQVDLVVVSAHMGTEYSHTPDKNNVVGARAAIDAGADLFIGHHPHWIQTIEEYKGKYIFYSLGNFVFDQMWSQETMEGLAINVLLEEKNISRIKLMPVITENYCCPRWATEEETKNILSKINLTDSVLSVKN